MKITYYGHSCFLIHADGKDFLFDPFISANSLAQHIDVDSISADYVCLTHGHQDHLLDAERILRTTGATLIASYEIANWYLSLGIERVKDMNIGGKVYIPGVGHLRAVNATHSSVLPDGTYGGNPMGFVLSTQAHTLYIAGDTALTYDMKLLPELYNNIDCAILPIGGTYTMDAEDAVRATQFVQTKKVIGCHYDTFPPIEIKQGEATEIFMNNNLELILPKIGDTIEL